MEATTLENALRLYAITPNGAAQDPSFKQVALALLRAGVRAIQFREKFLPPADVLALGRYLRAMTAEYSALLIVNDDPHLAQLIGADGCHLGQEDMTPIEARKILGREKIIGLSTHSHEQVLASRAQPVDYIGVGPIFRSSSKDVGRPLLGADFAGWATKEIDLPVVAIGGIDLNNVVSLTQAGCRNIAVISALAGAPNPPSAAQAFLECLQGAGSAERL